MLHVVLLNKTSSFVLGQPDFFPDALVPYRQPIILSPVNDSLHTPLLKLNLAVHQSMATSQDNWVSQNYGSLKAPHKKKETICDIQFTSVNDVFYILFLSLSPPNDAFRQVAFQNVIPCE